ncbi:hypothetical protein DT076_15595 [Desertihabitans brevis]|uniref:Uncharacterized protein n=1 Tax=Desertihabitans brevis TaxID=2268447 RepID=A0A367YS30_9ACTN|nr:hypothetical protein [Desertihabitans brevis]RCK68644.1 hypothetical protein DT076_15595 [Desertihabitans brevis]
MRELQRCEPWSLDQLERFLWVMATRRQFERFTLLGAWPVSPGSFVCVLDQLSTGPIGVTVDRHMVDDPPAGDEDAPSGALRSVIDASVWQTVATLTHLDARTVARWRTQGWVKDGIVWDRDPGHLTSPWSGYRPPRAGDIQLPVEERPWWEVKPPSGNADPWQAALEDLRGWAEQSMWASTLLIRRVVLDNPDTRREGRRWVAGWVIASNWAAHVEAVVWPRDNTGAGTQLRGLPGIPDEAALPGQRYLRPADMSVAGPGCYTDHLYGRHATDALNARLPHSALGGGVPRRGIAWRHRLSRRSDIDPTVLSTHPSADRMAAVIHQAIDTANPGR